MPKFYLTTPIYYINDKPHLGHAYTTIAADVLARWHRLAGDEVWFLTGTDEHGSKVAAAAQARGQEPQAFADEISAQFQFLWDRLDITNDDFIRTTSERHRQGVEAMLKKLQAAGALYQGEYEGLYCSGCERFLTEKELVNGLCPDHQKAPELIKEKNYFFKLKEYLPQVEKLIDRGRIKILPASKRQEVLGLIKQGLDDFSVSREKVKWGIALPFAPGQVAYVWVDALTNYLSALGYGAGEEKMSFWPANVHLMAKDILKFHALYWPAMLLAAGLEPPQVVFAHGFFTIDGQKMSKSLGNAIDPNALIDEFGSEAVRYLLLSQFPFGADGDVKAGDFAIQYNADLANGLGNFCSRSLAMAEKYFDGQVPEKDLAFGDEVAGIWREYREALENFQPDQAVSLIKKLSAFGDGYIERQKPWQLAQTNKEELAKVIYNLLEIIRHLAIMIYPIMPETGEKIMTALGCDDWKSRKLKDLSRWGSLEPGSRVSKGDNLFPRLEKKVK